MKDTSRKLLIIGILIAKTIYLCTYNCSTNRNNHSLNVIIVNDVANNSSTRLVLLALTLRVA